MENHISEMMLFPLKSPDLYQPPPQAAVCPMAENIQVSLWYLYFFSWVGNRNLGVSDLDWKDAPEKDMYSLILYRPWSISSSISDAVLPVGRHWVVPDGLWQENARKLQSWIYLLHSCPSSSPSSQSLMKSHTCPSLITVPFRQQKELCSAILGAEGEPRDKRKREIHSNTAEFFVLHACSILHQRVIALRKLQGSELPVG